MGLDFSGISNGFNNMVGGAAKAIGDAAQGYINDIGEGMSEVGEAFENGGLVNGGLEYLEQVSLGEGVGRQLEALGLGPKDGAGRDLIEGVANLVLGNPIGVRDILEGVGKLGETKKAVGAAAAASVSEPFACRSPDVARARPNAGKGWAADMLRPNMTVEQALNTMKTPLAGMQNAVSEAIDQAVGGRSGTPVTQMGGDYSIKDILNDPTLSFEDMVALVMFKVVEDEQEKVKGMLAQLDAIDDKGAAKAAGVAAAKQTGNAPRASDAAKTESAAPKQGPITPKESKPVTSPKPAEKTGGLEGLFESAASFVGNMVKDVFSEKSKPFVKAAVSAITPVIAAAVTTAITSALGISTGGVGLVAAPLIGVAVDFALQGAVDGIFGLADGAGPMMQAATADGASGLSPAQQEGVAVRAQQSKAEFNEATKGATENGKPDRATLMEHLKLATNKLSQMQQALSNVLKSMHDTSMASIRNIK